MEIREGVSHQEQTSSNINRMTHNCNKYLLFVRILLTALVMLSLYKIEVLTQSWGLFRLSLNPSYLSPLRLHDQSTIESLHFSSSTIFLLPCIIHWHGTNNIWTNDWGTLMMLIIMTTIQKRKIPPGARSFHESDGVVYVGISNWLHRLLFEFLEWLDQIQVYWTPI